MSKGRRVEGRKFWALACMLLLSATGSAGPAKLFEAGNKAYAEGGFDEAASAYREAAAESPGSAEIQYNLGNALYRQGLFEDAASTYEYAASLAETDALRSRCWYNMANSMVKTAEALRESEPQAAVQQCRQAAWLYRTALGYDAGFADAACNLEICQRIAAAIGEEIRKKEEKKQQENDLIKYIRKKLEEFIERQGQLNGSKDVGEPQKALEKETRALAAVMERSGLCAGIDMPDGTKMPGPLEETHGHVQKAAEAMAAPDQPLALKELVAALGSAPDDPDKPNGDSNEDSDEYDDSDMNYQQSDQDAEMYEEADPFGDFSEYEEIRGVPPPNRTETDILAEEIRNQERRKEKKAGKYKPVGKDW